MIWPLVIAADPWPLLTPVIIPWLTPLSIVTTRIGNWEFPLILVPSANSELVALNKLTVAVLVIGVAIALPSTPLALAKGAKAETI